MTGLVVLLVVVAVLMWASWGEEQKRRERIAWQYAKTFATAGLKFSSCTSDRVVLDVIDSDRYAAISSQSVVKACGQVLGGPVVLAEGHGVVTATRKRDHPFAGAG